MLRLLFVGLVLAGGWFGYQKLKDASHGDVPVGTDYIAPSPPAVSFNVKNPIP